MNQRRPRMLVSRQTSSKRKCDNLRNWDEIEKEQSKYSELRKKTGQLSERMIIRRSTSPVFPTTVWVICRSSAWQEAWGPRNNEVAAPLMFSIHRGLGTEATTVDGPNKVHNLRRDVIFCH